MRNILPFIKTEYLVLCKRALQIKLEHTHQKQEELLPEETRDI